MTAVWPALHAASRRPHPAAGAGTSVLAGAAGTALFPSHAGIYGGILLPGFCFNGWGEVSMTALMNMDGMMPRLMGGAVAIYSGLGGDRRRLRPGHVLFLPGAVRHPKRARPLLPLRASRAGRDRAVRLPLPPAGRMKKPCAGNPAQGFFHRCGKTKATGLLTGRFDLQRTVKIDIFAFGAEGPAAYKTGPIC